MSNKKIKIENIMLVIVFLIAIILSFYFVIKKTKTVTENEYKSSLESVTILDNQLILEDYKRTYNAIVDCSKFEKDQNIIDYKLKESNDVIVRYAFYKDDKLLEEPSKKMTNFDIYMSLYNSKQEIVYHFVLTCGV